MSQDFKNIMIALLIFHFSYLVVRGQDYGKESKPSSYVESIPNVLGESPVAEISEYKYAIQDPPPNGHHEQLMTLIEPMLQGPDQMDKTAQIAFLKNIRLMVMENIENKRISSDARAKLENLDEIISGLLRETSLINQDSVDNLMMLAKVVMNNVPLNEGSLYTDKKAPFGKLGHDDFEDVDHKEIAQDIMGAAKLLIAYLKQRSMQPDAMMGGDDAILTQIVMVLGKLHRASLRNWHHLLMLTSNLANDISVQDPNR